MILPYSFARMYVFNTIKDKVLKWLSLHNHVIIMKVDSWVKVHL